MDEILMVWEQRVYQQEAIAATLAGFVEKGVASVMLESPVGSGKTYMALEAIHRLQEQWGRPMRVNFERVTPAQRGFRLMNGRWLALQDGTKEIEETLTQSLELLHLREQKKSALQAQPKFDIMSHIHRKVLVSIDRATGVALEICWRGRIKMGAYYEIDGELTFGQKPSEEVMKAINALYNQGGKGDMQAVLPEGAQAPSTWSPWKISDSDALTVEYDCSRFFVEWLCVIIQYILHPRGIVVNGSVKWAGDGETGTIEVRDNTIITKGCSFKDWRAWVNPCCDCVMNIKTLDDAVGCVAALGQTELPRKEIFRRALDGKYSTRRPPAHWEGSGVTHLVCDDLSWASDIAEAKAAGVKIVSEKDFLSSLSTAKPNAATKKSTYKAKAVCRSKSKTVAAKK